jgi:hypothetical protein
MDDINIECFRDIENISVSELVNAIVNDEFKSKEAFQKDDLKVSLIYYKIYLELQILLGKKLKTGMDSDINPEVISSDFYINSSLNFFNRKIRAIFHWIRRFS